MTFILRHSKALLRQDNVLQVRSVKWLTVGARSKRLLKGGEFHVEDATNNEIETSFAVTNPSTQSIIGYVPDMGEAETEVAIDTAYRAFNSWRKTTAKERSTFLRKWADQCEKHKDGLASLITSEMGKPLRDASQEVAYGISFMEWFAEEGRRVFSDIVPSPKIDRKLIIAKQPIGVAGMITPWNFPHAMIARKVSAAIAAGCTVIIKPAEDTPFSALALCELAEEAGLPHGVLQVVTSSRDNTPTVGRVMCESPRIPVLSFTGSTLVGKTLLQQSAFSVKRLVLELGGNAPFLVFESADIGRAVSSLIDCKFRCSGQTCVSANRILVQESIYDEFIETLAHEMNLRLKVGDGFAEDTTQGPLINNRAVAKVHDHVVDAVSKGAKAIRGGRKLGGNFYEPTLLTDVTTDMKCCREETFGPIAPIIRFGTEEEALKIANDTNYGLAGYCFSENMHQILRIAEQLETGIIGINEALVSTPEGSFGGWKESGLGSEGGKYGIDEYLHKKYICLGGL